MSHDCDAADIPRTASGGGAEGGNQNRPAGSTWRSSPTAAALRRERIRRTWLAPEPVKWDRGGRPRRGCALVVNAGNANAATATGDANVLRTATLAAEAIGCQADDVLVASDRRDRPPAPDGKALKPG